MNIIATKPITMEEMFEKVKLQFPQYKVELKKNPLMRFQYIQVSKSSTVGCWIRLKESKITLVGAIPSTFIRAMFGGLILIAFISGKLKRLTAELGGYLKTQYE
ncbi:MAG: hypothetical protein ABIX01_18315 [Chitinophagaceae bacterium]